MSAATFRVLVVGCGQLGSRHLQAISALPMVAAVDVVDPRSESLALGQQRLGEVADRQRHIAYRWLSSLSEATAHGDLCIVATRAEGRCELVQTIADTLGYRRFLLEKIVGQSVHEVEQLAAFVHKMDLSAWVNCKTRTYPFHQRAKQRVDPAEPILMTVVGGNHGLANNGIHAADLFAFYDSACEIIGSDHQAGLMLYRTKRGLYDLSGTLHGVSDKGSHFTLAYAADHEQSEVIAITSRRYRCLVDHFLRWAVESDAESNWAWRPVPFEGDLTVSAMTRTFASDMLTKGQCALPSLEDSLIAHRFILGQLQPHFSRLLEQDVALCPVT